MALINTHASPTPKIIGGKAAGLTGPGKVSEEVSTGATEASTEVKGLVAEMTPKTLEALPEKQQQFIKAGIQFFQK